VGLFSRNPASHPDDGEDETTLQDHAADMTEAIADLDEAFLARLTPEQRVEPGRARDLMYTYFDAMWDDLKARGLNPADDDRYSVVAGLRDLTGYFQANTINAIHEIDGSDAETPSPAVIARREAERRAELEKWLETATLEELLAAQPTANPADVIDINGAIVEARGW